MNIIYREKWSIPDSEFVERRSREEEWCGVFTRGHKETLGVDPMGGRGL